MRGGLNTVVMRRGMVVMRGTVVSFVLLGSMIILNLFIGVILTSMEEAKQSISNKINRK